MTLATGGRKLVLRRRDPDDDAETRVYVRQGGMTWDRAMVRQMMSELGPFVRATPPPRLSPVPQPRPSPVPQQRRSPVPQQRRSPVPAARMQLANAHMNVPDALTLVRPNVFLTPFAPTDPSPPWGFRTNEDDTRASDTHVPVSRMRSRLRARRSLIPWFAFVMYFCIAFGVGEDRVLRRQLVSDLRGTARTAVSRIDALLR